MRDAGSTKRRGVGIVVPLILLMAPTVGFCQEDEDEEGDYVATATLFSDVTHLRRDANNDTRLGAGIRGDVGANLSSGAHSFLGRYGATVETEQADLDDLTDVGELTELTDVTGVDGDNFLLRGASRYNYYEPGRPFDFNAGHTIRSVRNETGFVLDDFNYDTQNTISAGGGVSLYPGPLTSFRLATQAGKTWSDGNAPDGETVSANARLARRVSEQSSVSLTASRAWVDEEDTNDVTIDSASVGLESSLENGFFSLSGGISRAESDDFENEAIIGSLARLWSSDVSRTRLSYDRTQSSDLLDLTLDPIPLLDFEDEEDLSIRYQGVTVRDQVTALHSTSRICDLCTVRVIGWAAKEENVVTNEDSWEYLFGTGVGIAMTDVETLDFDYSWQADSYEDRTAIEEQLYRFIVTYSHQLTATATWGASFETKVRIDEENSERYRARLFITVGLNDMEEFW